jgi:non-specific serine/threonine protein kinase
VERDNLRAALAWLLEHEAEAALRLAGAIRRFWALRGHLAEGRRWLALALERSPDAPARVLVKALNGAGYLALHQGDLAEARRLFEQSMRRARETGDLMLLGWALQGLGGAALDQGDLAEARALLDECVAIGRQIGNTTLVVNSLIHLGEAARMARDNVAARGFYEQAVALAREAGQIEGLSIGLIDLGAVAYGEGDLASSRAHYLEALPIFQRLGNTAYIAFSLDGLAAIAARGNEWERAARLAGAAEALREQVGFALPPVDREVRERYLADLRDALGEGTLVRLLAEGGALSLDRVIEMALAAA